MDEKNTHNNGTKPSDNLPAFSRSESETGSQYNSRSQESLHGDSRVRRRHQSMEKRKEGQTFCGSDSKCASARAVSYPLSSVRRGTMSPHPSYGVAPSNSKQRNPPYVDMNTSAGTSMSWISNPFSSASNYYCIGAQNSARPSEPMAGCYGMYPMQSVDPTATQDSRAIRTEAFCLYPPHPKAPPPITREKPDGCKTVFVGGLPENTTEEILREIFERCGKISTIRMSKKNFCHIRFTDERAVDHAIDFSGHRLKVNDKDDALNNSRIHVDYANARDDAKDYECYQRYLRREARHRKRMEDEINGLASLRPIVKYSDHEASILKKMFTNENFTKAVSILVTWLERGECNKENSNQFLSLISCTKSHIVNLIGEKNSFKAKLTESENELSGKNQLMLSQCEEVIKVFDAACLQKAWDHFTQAQQKNIEYMKNTTKELMGSLIKEQNLEVSDNQSEIKDQSDTNGTILNSDIKLESEVIIEKLKEDNDVLQCQIKAFESELAVIRAEGKREIQYETETKKLKQELEAVEEEKLQIHCSQEESATEGRPLKMKKQDSNVSLLPHTEGSSSHMGISSADVGNENLCINRSSNAITTISESEALLIGLIFSFLSVHPFGASIDYICSYLNQIDQTVRERDVEELMRRYQSMFKEVTKGIGATLGRKWLICGFN